MDILNFWFTHGFQEPPFPHELKNIVQIKHETHEQWYEKLHDFDIFSENTQAIRILKGPFNLIESENSINNDRTLYFHYFTLLRQTFIHIVNK